MQIYLYEEIAIKGRCFSNNNIITIVELKKKIKVSEIDYVKKEIIHWDKNYAIMGWLLEKLNYNRRVGDPYNFCWAIIRTETLIELRNVLRRIVVAQTEKEARQIAKDKLKTNDDDYTEYLRDFVRTYCELDKLINSPDFNHYYYYYCCIWF